MAISTGDAPIGGVEASISGSTLTIAHDAFVPDTEHTVTVPAGAVIDRSGNALAAPVSWRFATAPAAEPGELAQVHVIDVGQGDSIYVELPGEIDVPTDC